MWLDIDSLGEKINIKFFYEDCTGDDSGITHEVECVIEDYNGDCISAGSSFCNKNDQFVKSVGRKLALKRAMEDAWDDRAVRTEIWSKVKERMKLV